MTNRVLCMYRSRNSSLFAEKLQLNAILLYLDADSNVDKDEETIFHPKAVCGP